jgi:hypothetical protein
MMETALTAAVRAALVACLAYLALGLVPAGASAATTFDTDCFGKITRGADTENGQITYDFACTQAFAGYTIVSLDQEIATFDTETLAFNYQTGEAATGEEYSCQGAIPTNGVSCNGKASGGNRVRGNVDIDNPCALPRPRFAVVVADAKGSPSPVFPLFVGAGPAVSRPMTGCPKPPKKTVVTKPKKKAAKQAVRRAH